MPWRFMNSLAKTLRALELGRLLLGTEDGQPTAGELVDDAEGQRQLGADHRQVDLELGGEVGQLVDLVGGDGSQVGDLGDAGIARSAVELLHQRALAELPAQGVLPAARSDDQDLHVLLDPASGGTSDLSRSVECGDRHGVEHVVSGAAAGEVVDGTPEPLEQGSDGAGSRQPLGELVGDITRIEVGKTRTLARPATALPGALRRATARTSAASPWSSPSKAKSTLRRRSSAPPRAPRRGDGWSAEPLVENASSATRGSSSSSRRHASAACMAMSASCDASGWGTTPQSA